MKQPYLLDKNLCHRCGACFYLDEAGVLDTDSQGFPVLTEPDRADTETLLACCSGRKIFTEEMYRTVHPHAEYAYHYDKPDLGYVAYAGIAFAKYKNIREAGQSGGVITALCLGALQMGLVQSVLCVKRSPDDPFAATYHVARTRDELMEAVRSKYVICSPLQGIHNIKKSGNQFAAVTLSCQTHSLRQLEQHDPFVRDNLKFVIGPFCGFNLEKAAGQAVARVCGINPKKVAIFENRGGRFPGITRIVNTGGTERHLIRTYHRILYRSFVPNRCYSCVDYTNEFADVSIADAFLQNKTGFLYPDGAAWVLTRTAAGKQVVDYCIESGLLEYIPKTVEEAADYWREGVVHRKVRGYNRNLRFARRGIAVPDYGVEYRYTEQYRPVDRQFALTVALLRRAVIRRFALRWFYRCAVSTTTRGKRWYTFLGRRVFTYKSDAFPLISVRHALKRCAKMMKSAFSKIPVLYRLINALSVLIGIRRPAKKYKRVVIAGGYGNHNVGDEAQLAFNIGFLQQKYPEYEIVVLSPDPYYTTHEHTVRSELAPRVVFFHSDTRSHYSKANLRFKLMFFLKTPRLLLNARLTYAGLPMLGVYPQEAHLLDVLNKSSLLLLSGGGYLTGSTASRLWDNALLIRLAHTMGVAAVASGQTIGVFKTRLNRMVARWGLSKLRSITVRDREASLNDLASIGITGPRVIATFDDALFCDTASKKRMQNLLQDNGIPDNTPYVAVNVHYWGQRPDLSQEMIRHLARACDDLIHTHGVYIVFVPMHPTDEQPARDVLSIMRSKDARLLAYPYDYRDARGVIGGARCCITMKHHPIVFACGEGTPVMSLVFDDYYQHKNEGALSLFDMQQFVIRYDKETDMHKAILRMFDELNSRHDEINRALLTRLEQYKPDAGKSIRSFFDSSRQDKKR